MNSLDAGRHFVDDGENIFFRNDEVLGAFDLDFAPRVFAVEHTIADLDVHLDLRALIGHAAASDGTDHALLGLLLGRIGKKDAAGRLVVLLYVFDNDVIEQGLEIHGNLQVG